MGSHNKANWLLQNALRILLLAALIFPAWRFLSGQQTTYAQGTYAQVWGKRSGSFYGVRARVSTPDPALSSGWSVAPTSVGDLVSRFIEAGPMKRSSGSRHPYASWIDENGVGGFSERTDINLAAGGYYRYKVYYTGTGAWVAMLEYGTGYAPIAMPQLYRYSPYPWVVSGGESSSFNNPIGPLSTTENRYRTGYGSGAPWYAWCYTHVHNNCDGAITPCNNFSWLVSYSP